MTNYREILIADEGLNLKPYRCTENKLTIGVGRNLDDRGISDVEAIFLLDNDIADAVESARALVAKFEDLTEARRKVIVSMIFQMGAGGLSNFRRMLGALDVGDYETAAIEMLDSRWSTQTPERAQRLSDMMRDGSCP